MSDMIKEAKEQLKSFNLSELAGENIHKHRFAVWRDSQTVVTYPPRSIMPKMDPEEIFKEDNHKPFTLYFHMPFCNGKCLYCGYCTYPNQSESVVNGYLESLKKDVTLYLQQDQVKDAEIRSVYVGGGTPTYLSAEQLDNILAFINDTFKLKKSVEFTVESSPETQTEEKLITLLNNNVNRLSLGVQTFNDEILRLLLRRHDSKQAIDAYQNAKDVGFKNVNLDIIRSLPDITPETFLKDLEIIEDLKPESLTCYHSILKSSAAMRHLYVREPWRFPDEQTSYLLHLMVIKKMASLDYNQNPNDWFHRKSKVYNQQIQKWKEMINLLGFGVSAYSLINNIQFHNSSDLSTYKNCVDNGKSPVNVGLYLSKDEQMHRKFIFGLKTEIDKAEFQKDFGPIRNSIRTKLDKYKNLDLIYENDEIVKLTEKGILLADEICTKFYSDSILQQLRESWVNSDTANHIL